MTLKMAVLAPIPKANVRIARRVKVGLRANMRNPSFKSLARLITFPFFGEHASV